MICQRLIFSLALIFIQIIARISANNCPPGKIIVEDVYEEYFLLVVLQLIYVILSLAQMDNASRIHQ